MISNSFGDIDVKLVNLCIGAPFFQNTTVLWFLFYIKFTNYTLFYVWLLVYLFYASIKMLSLSLHLFIYPFNLSISLFFSLDKHAVLPVTSVSEHHEEVYDFMLSAIKALRSSVLINRADFFIFGHIYLLEGKSSTQCERFFFNFY